MIVSINGKRIKLPDFFIVGAGKSGTTSLAKYLSEHPQIYIPDLKEPQFFSFYNCEYNNNRPKPFLYIRDFDDYVSLFIESSEEQKLGEASTSYSIPYMVDKTIHNMKSVYGDLAENLKFIFIIRNPIERIFSAYIMYVDIGIEDLSFEKAILSGIERIKKGYRLELNYIDNNKISESIEAYIKSFGKPKVRIYLYEDLKERPLWLLRDLFEFLEVDPNFVPSNLGVAYNISGIPKSPVHKVIYNVTVRYNPLKPIIKKILPEHAKGKVAQYLKKILYTKPQMSPEVREKLKEIFKEDILKLQELIGRDLSHWLK
ncbi:sulfotransferase family protein [Persephonella sp.]